MLCTVVRGAKNHEPVFVVIAALRARYQVVNVDERRVATSWDDTASAITTQHLAPHGRRDLLMGASCAWDLPIAFGAPLLFVAARRPHVGARLCRYAPDVLRIASRHLQHLGANQHLLAASL